MKLYKYRGIAEYHLTSLKDNTISFTPIKELNDPNEGFIDKTELEYFLQNMNSIILEDITKSVDNKKYRHFYDSYDAIIDRTQRQYIKKLIKKHPTEIVLKKLGIPDPGKELNILISDILQYIDKVGIYSLSADPLQMLMWSHYSDNHKGFAIEYDIPIENNSHMYTVEYNDYPPKINEFDVLFDPDLQENIPKMVNLMKKMFNMKSLDWKYEQEYRIINPEHGLTIFSEKIKGIYFGLNMSDKNKNTIRDNLKGQNIQYYQVKHKINSYELEAQPIK